ncbi:MAG: Uma2 family endonuclease [Eubacterium sp.]|nr:Uma2 family endonuclease [Eubacterium sp.]
MPPALQSQPESITLEQYEALPESQRAEVFHGQIYYMASPSRDHQIILTELLFTIRAYLKKKGSICQVFPTPFDVKLSDQPLTIVQPDIFIVCDKYKVDKNRCNGAPDFIIEIVSPGNPSDDYIRKLYLYKNHGVREYWIVDPRHQTISVNNFKENISTVQYSFDATVQVHIYNDLYIHFDEIKELLE